MTGDSLIDSAEIFANIQEKAPVVHNISNYITATDCANMTLACGGSPTMADDPDEVEIVNPSISVLAQPSVAVVDEVAENRGTEEASREYLNYLYSDEAQRIAAQNYYRPVNKQILNEYKDVFDLGMELKTIDDFGGWQEVQQKHFADGGVFDRIYGN